MAELGARRLRRRILGRILLPLGIAILATVPFLLNARQVMDIDLLDTVDNAVYDAKVRVMRSGKIDRRIVIVDIDDTSILAEGQWPWARDKLASLVDNLFNKYGVRTVGFDMVFSEPDRVTHSVRQVLDDLLQREGLAPQARKEISLMRDKRDTDARFAQALAGGLTVLGYIFTGKNRKGVENAGLLPRGTEVKKTADFPAYPYKSFGYLANLPMLQRAASAGGYFDNPLVDADGVFRRMPMLQYYGGELYETLGLAVLRTAYGIEPPVLGTFDDGGNPDLDYMQIGDFYIPVDDNIAVLVPYRGLQGSFPYVSATDVIRGKADIETLFDSIVLVGTTASGLFDLRSTPVDNVYAGVEIHANIISGILDGRFWHKPDWARQYEIIAFLSAAVLLALTMPHLAPLTGALLVLAVIGLGVTLNFVLAFGGLMVLPLASYVASTFFVALLLIGLNVMTERRTKRYLSKTFAKYVPRELVAQFESTEEEVTLEGESRDMSVLFADIRNFTSISEYVPPKELTQLMNDYLTPITRVIHSHRGNVDKYIGDAVMAFWGAPQENPRHAKDALLAAMEMQRVLATIRGEFRDKGWPEFHMGIGINSGVVNIGNMGSEYRTAYTVMGDVVNLASRLEGLSRFYDVGIVVGEAVVRQVKGFYFRELDMVRVKGKKEPVTIYEPIGRSLTDSLCSDLDAYERALALYRRQEWAAARTAFERLAVRQPTYALYRIYIQRCEEYRRQPPPSGWDGAFQMTSK